MAGWMLDHCTATIIPTTPCKKCNCTLGYGSDRGEQLVSGFYAKLVKAIKVRVNNPQEKTQYKYIPSFL